MNDLDSGVAVDSKMADLLDGIESATDPSIPLFTVGNDRSALDTRDPKEIIKVCKVLLINKHLNEKIYPDCFPIILHILSALAP